MPANSRTTKGGRRRRSTATPERASHRADLTTEDQRNAEKQAIIGEIALLTDQQDALKAEIKARKDRLLLLMAQDGDRAVEVEGVGTAGFQRRRSFKVRDSIKLSKMFSAAILAENMKVTAAFYDAAEREGHRIAEVVTVGEDESLTITRSRTAQAKQIREHHIAEARKKAEGAVAAYRKQLKQF